MNTKVIPVLLAVIIVLMLAGGGYYLYAHQRCSDGSYGTPGQCQQVDMDQYREFGNKVKDLQHR